MSAPNLLNDDGSASMATMLMMSHHAFRRDLARFGVALEKVAAGDTSAVEALRSEWQNYHGALHGHHMMEDSRVFPHLAGEHASVAPTIARLTEEHHRIDPLLERGDRAFEALPETRAAQAVVTELKALLEPHLATEEAEVVPFLRAAKQFPAPATDAEADLYAQGFAWSTHGIAGEVLERVFSILPESLTSRLPAARTEFERRCERVWGSVRGGSATTPIPNAP
jgi:hemerythrin-like domain-containing protein